MRIGKYPTASIVLVLLFGSKFIVNYFFPEKAEVFEPVITGIFEIALVVFIIYYLTLFVKWTLNYRKAA